MKAVLAAILTLALGPVAIPAPGAAQAQQVATAAAPGAVLRGLDKMAGRSEDLRLNVGESINFGRLTITLTDCRYPVDDPAADAFAHLVIHDQRETEPVFRGWMVASSPALSALDHVRFDVWLIRCTSS